MMMENNQQSKNQETCALILGGYINGYSIVRELHEQNIENIALFDTGNSISRFSNKLNYLAEIDKSPERLLLEIVKLKKSYNYIVVYPTDDLQIENLVKIYDDISSFCYLPFNRRTVIEGMDKGFQYKKCAEIGVPFPKTYNIERPSDLNIIEKLNYPVLIKPATRKDLTISVFRNIYISNYEDCKAIAEQLNKYFEHGIKFLISEYIPGNDGNIYAYTCFRSNEGEILNEWTGRKLSQYPNNYGVFSSASNEAPKILMEQGRNLVQALNAYGIVEPEFKYDARDNKFKLMETNFRSMMWHRVGSLSGVKLQETQYKYATGSSVTKYSQEKNKTIHFIFMAHEIYNLIKRKNYFRQFKNNLFGGDIRAWAIFNSDDLKPFLYGLLLPLRYGVAACLKRLKEPSASGLKKNPRAKRRNNSQ